jgi:hypothetical protein
MSDAVRNSLLGFLAAHRRAAGGFIYTRQDLTDHDPAEPKPYPTRVKWFATQAEAEEYAERAEAHFADDPH